ncbi:MAG: hypothetical protein LQ348_006741 [Seirophora lacunosa]|nr:MAG: hypothetical protein LQ344_001773 [Seirophora lacunosa]KAI4172557.1 MAG: hypothetical protein LQ348_006741 [Seirophora lacunosa]
MIKAIFFCAFDIKEGPKVLHQVPADSIVPSATSTQIPLFHFPSLSSYIIPRPEFCSRLITFCTPTHRILSHPVCLPSPSYPRNAYTFSIALVLNLSTPFASYATVTLKLASLLRTLEEQSRFLSRDTSAPNTGKVYALCEILLEDLNNYCESMIPIDDSNTLNIKLFPTYPPPPPLYPYHVPLSTVRLDSLTDPNWDLTMLRVLPHIDGINSVKQISLLADADYKLVRKAIEHLLYYGCLLLLDIFSFSAIYAPTAELANFVEDVEMQAECARYVALPVDGYVEGSKRDVIDGFQMVELYLSLKQGQNVKAFYIEHAEIMNKMDVRRFITFGVIKGFLYRVHKYAIATSQTSRRKRDPKTRFKQKKTPSISVEAGTDDVDSDLAELEIFLDGTHCFDEICTELMINEQELMGRLKAIGDVQIICR